MRFIPIVLIFLHIQKPSNESVNYCGARMCAHTNAHTYCRYPIGPTPSCTGYINAGLLAEEKARILARLNRRRSDVARGVRGWPTAGDMLKLRWVEELAREAQRWADQCKPPSSPEEHDTCRDLYSITVGQCVASVVGEAPGLRPESMVDLWYMQSMQYKGNVSSYTLPSKDTHKYYGDFAQTIWSRSYMVGCGRSRFMIPWNGRLRSVERLVCNFAPRGPVPQRPLWAPSEPASACPPRSLPDDDLPALCTFQHNMDETYDEDNMMSLQEHLLLNTIMEIERNASVDHIGVIDEIYLTKIAIATIGDAVGTPFYISIQKRDIGNDTNEVLAQNESNINMNRIQLPKRKYMIVGRPKAYRDEDLTEPITDRLINEINDETKNVEKYIYGDYETMDGQEDTIQLTSTTISSVSKYEKEREDTVKEIEETTNTATDVSLYNMSNTYILTNTEPFGLLLNDMILKLNISNGFNQTYVDDIFSNPETVRQLEEALDRMEQKLAEPTHSGKVRRELRNQSNEKTPLDKDLERNKSLDRGPMLNMVMKYLPYLKPYEKSILGETSVNSASTLNVSTYLVTYYLIVICV